MGCSTMLAPEGGDATLADAEATALLALLEFLKRDDYRFVTPTPATHARVLKRPERAEARDLSDIFGWSLPFRASLLNADLAAKLGEAHLIDEAGGLLRSRVRVSSLGSDLFVHSAYPTVGRDAVFLGPDSYRFARLITEELRRCPYHASSRLVDIGTGAGVGAIVAARVCPTLDVAMTDINPAALRMASINARAAGVQTRCHRSGDLSCVDGDLDIVLANPPYIVDAGGRSYRDGGGMHGGAVSLAMARDAVPRLAPGGRLILYTGSAIQRGNDPLREELVGLADEQLCALRYAEIDPDVFGEELDTPAYRDTDRIALVAAVIERPAEQH